MGVLRPEVGSGYPGSVFGADPVTKFIKHEAEAVASLMSGLCMEVDCWFKDTGPEAGR